MVAGFQGAQAYGVSTGARPRTHARAHICMLFGDERIVSGSPAARVLGHALGNEHDATAACQGVLTALYCRAALLRSSSLFVDFLRLFVHTRNAVRECRLFTASSVVFPVE